MTERSIHRNRSSYQNDHQAASETISRRSESNSSGTLALRCRLGLGAGELGEGACGSKAASAILRKVPTPKKVLFAQRSWRFVVLKKSIIAMTLAAVLVLSMAGQDKKKEWKDRAEYDLYESITKTQDPNQWLGILDKWKAAYPQSDYGDVRRQMYLATYRALNKPRQAFDAAQEVLKDHPN